MSMHRETFFHCTFASRGRRRTAIIRAWDARTAESLFRELLDDEVDEGGTIEVETRAGGLARRVAFEPRSSLDGALTP